MFTSGFSESKMTEIEQARSWSPRVILQVRDADQEW